MGDKTQVPLAPLLPSFGTLSKLSSQSLFLLLVGVIIVLTSLLCCDD